MWRKTFTFHLVSGGRVRVRAKECKMTRAGGTLDSCHLFGLRTWGPRRVTMHLDPSSIVAITYRRWLR